MKTPVNLESYTLGALRKLAKKRNIDCFSRLTKKDLVRRLQQNYASEAEAKPRWWTWTKVGTLASAAGLGITVYYSQDSEHPTGQTKIEVAGDHNISHFGNGDLSITNGVPIEDHEVLLERYAEISVKHALSSEAIISFCEVFHRNGLSESEQRKTMRDIAEVAKALLTEIAELQIEDPEVVEIKRRAYQILASDPTKDGVLKAKSYLAKIIENLKESTPAEIERLYAERSRIYTSLIPPFKALEDFAASGFNGSPPQPNNTTSASPEFQANGEVDETGIGFLALAQALGFAANEGYYFSALCTDERYTLRFDDDPSEQAWGLAAEINLSQSFLRTILKPQYGVPECSTVFLWEMPWPTDVPSRELSSEPIAFSISGLLPSLVTPPNKDGSVTVYPRLHLIFE